MSMTGLATKKKGSATNYSNSARKEEQKKFHLGHVIKKNALLKKYNAKHHHHGSSQLYASTHNFHMNDEDYDNSMDRDKMKRSRVSKEHHNNNVGGAINLRRAMKALKHARIDEHEPSFSSPHVQYFLASLCDLDLRPKLIVTNGIRARCPLVPDVEKAVCKLNSFQTINAEEYDLAVVVSALKEFLHGIHGGIFNELTTEFYEISLKSSLDITIMYLHSIIHSLPYIVQQFTYLLCKAFRNLVRLSGGQSVANYTDLLMIFTPALFPGSIADVTYFLRAARLLLVMVDHCSRVFLPLPLLDCDGKWYWINSEYEEKAFVREILTSLRYLEAKLMLNDSGIELQEESEDTTTTGSEDMSPSDFDDHQKQFILSHHSFSLPDLYRFAYLDPADE